MDWADRRAKRIVDGYRHLFRGDAAHLADGMRNELAGEMRAVFFECRKAAEECADDASKRIRSLPFPR